MYLQPIEIFGIVTITPLFLYSGFLFFLKKGDRVNHIFLGLFLFTMALYTMNYIVISLNRHLPFDLYQATLHGRSLSFLLGPFLYFYVKSRCSKTIIFNYRFTLHFVPFLFSAIYYIFIYKNYILLFYSFKYIQLTIYVPFIIFALTKYKKEIGEYFSSAEEFYIQRLRTILALYILLLSIDLVFFFRAADIIAISVTIEKVLTYLSMFFTFMLPYYVIFDYTRNPELRRKTTSHSQKYESSSLSQEQSKEYSKKVIEVLEEKNMYLDSSVSLENLAMETGISAKILSQVLNETLDKSFYELINFYRIEYAKKELRRDSKKTILEILLESGFNSKSAFNRAFKNATGLTPSTFKNKSTDFEKKSSTSSIGTI